MRNPRLQLFISFLLIAHVLVFAQQRRKVIVNQDCSGPGGSNMQTLLTLIQSPQVDVLGITVVSGNQWRDEEVAHTLRLLELIGRTDIPVVPGAVFPLVHRREEALLWQARYGKVAFAGATAFALVSLIYGWVLPLDAASEVSGHRPRSREV